MTKLIKSELPDLTGNVSATLESQTSTSAHSLLLVSLQLRKDEEALRRQDTHGEEGRSGMGSEEGERTWPPASSIQE